MNRTFKVVFNRARACLVVANEITRAIQKKGAKSVLVATVLVSGLVLFPASYAHAEKSGGQIDTPASGDYGNTDTLTGKAVSVTEGETITGSVYGAYTTTDLAEVSGNSVTVSKSTVKSSGGRTSVGGISGGCVLVYEGENPTATANDNKVTVSNGSTFEGLDISAGIFGGLVYTYTETEDGNATAATNNNSVNVSGESTVKGALYSKGIIGGYAFSSNGISGDATATANGNSVSVSNSKVEVDITGGHAYANAESGNVIATANNNSVSVLDKSEVFGNIYGGYANTDTQNTGYAKDNTVTIDSATVESGKIIVGGAVFADTSNAHTATGNTINLTGAYSINGTSLYGGYNASSDSVGSNDDLFTGNTLNLDARKVSTTTVSNVANFQTINIQAGNVSNGDTILATTSTTLGNGTSGTTVNLVSMESSSLKAGDTLTLISNATGILANDGETLSLSEEESFAISSYDAKISLTNGSVIATVLGATANPETKVLNEARVASQAFINSGTDLLLDTNIEGGAFGAIRGGHSRYKTGSSAEIDGVNLVAGLAHTFAGKSGDTTGGVFFEAGWGDTTTHNTIGSKNLKGSGDTHYYGAGLLARYEQKEGVAKGLYADAAFRVGRLSNDYHNNDARNASGERVSFDIGSTYYAAHVGIGYKWDLTNSLRLDTSAQYMWSHVDSKNVAILGDNYHFDSMNSHRTRVGVKLDYTGAKNYTPYIGLAWEHEFKGEAKASVQGNAVDKADLGGASGIVSLGVDFKPSENSPFIFNAGFVGHFGEHKGAAGQLMMQYKF